MRLGPRPRVHPFRVHFFRPQLPCHRGHLRRIHAPAQIVLRALRAFLPVNQPVTPPRLLLEHDVLRRDVQRRRRRVQRRVVPIHNFHPQITRLCRTIENRDRQLLLLRVALPVAINFRVSERPPSLPVNPEKMSPERINSGGASTSNPNSVTSGIAAPNSAVHTLRPAGSFASAISAISNGTRSAGSVVSSRICAPLTGNLFPRSKIRTRKYCALFSE